MISIVPKIVYENACAKIHLHMYNSLTKYVFCNRDTSIFVFGFVYEKSQRKNKNYTIREPKTKNSCSTQRRLLTDIKFRNLQEFERELIVSKKKKDLLPFLSRQTHNENEI